MPEAAAKPGGSSQNSVNGETAEFVEELLCRESPARCPHEGAAGRDDGVVAKGCAGMVPEQAVQGQEEDEQQAWQGRISEKILIQLCMNTYSFVGVRILLMKEMIIISKIFDIKTLPYF